MFRYIAYLTLIAGLQITAHAADGPWAVESVDIHLIDEVQSAAIIPNATTDCSQGMRTNSLSPTDLSAIFTIGQKVWDIVQANKPVVNVGAAPMLSALPYASGCWMDLTGWQQPKTQTYEVSYKNGFGIEVVNFRFRLQFTYGGGIEGAGKFIANATVVPDQLNVLWGYTFNAGVVGDQAVNLGTAAAPLAGIGLTMNWTVKTVLKESDNSFHFFIQGDGVVKTDGQANLLN